jgi:ParB family chromosome partitioning protein
MTTVQMIPIAKIHVLNARARNKTKFKEIVANIAQLGLKKPITVSPRQGDDGGYDLVCGQGRLEAYVMLKQTEIPAIVVDLAVEDRYVRSLVENIARRHRTTLEMANELLNLKNRGYSRQDIAAKVGLSPTYVGHLLKLLQKGEERLVDAVERGEIPIAVATQIAEAGDEEVQRSLREAYEKGELRGRALIRARRLVDSRRARGKSFRGGKRDSTKASSARDLVRTYRKETQRQGVLVKKAHHCEQQLRFVTSALGNLLADVHFVNLLRAEKLDEMPKYLAETVHKP